MQIELAFDSVPYVAFELLPLNAIEQRAHDLAIFRAKDYHHSTSELLASIEEVDRLRIFEKFGLRSSLAYCCQYLKLSEDVALAFITVARKTRVSPALKEAIKNEELGISKARRICSVLTSQNETEWVEKAKELSKAELEKEVAQVTPKPVTKSSAKPVGPNRTRYQFEGSDEFIRKYRRVLDLENQRQAKSVDMEEALLEALDAYLESHDPVLKAERAQKRKATRQKHEPVHSARAVEKTAQEQTSPAKAAIPAANRHEANLRDRGECRALMPDGNSCRATRWTDLHHIRPLSEGGTHAVENLVTLCGTHHRQWHKLHHERRYRI